MDLETGPAPGARVGLAGQQVHELLDFYHAVQHLGQVAALRKDWSTKARAHWRTHQRRLLLRGQVEQVIVAVRRLCRGRNSKAMRTQLDYFIKHQRRMAYAKLMAMQLPIGSGAIESAVRCVINLRLKGPVSFGVAPVRRHTSVAVNRSNYAWPSPPQGRNEEYH